MDVAPAGALPDPPEPAAWWSDAGDARDGQARRETGAIPARQRNAVALAIAVARLRHSSRPQNACASELALFSPTHCCAGATEKRHWSAQRVCDWRSVALATGMVDCWRQHQHPGLLRCHAAPRCRIPGTALRCWQHTPLPHARRVHRLRLIADSGMAPYGAMTVSGATRQDGRCQPGNSSLTRENDARFDALPAWCARQACARRWAATERKTPDTPAFLLCISRWRSWQIEASSHQACGAGAFTASGTANST